MKTPKPAVMIETRFAAGEIEAAANAIANARGARRGVPQVTNVLSLLSDKLRDEMTEDAVAALRAASEWRAVNRSAS